MSEFIAFDDNVEVYGDSILMIIEALGDKALPALKQHGLETIESGTWYSLQSFLNAFKDLAEGDFQSTLDLVSIGMKVPEIALWPPDIKTIEDALYSIDAAYQMNHRNGDIGRYETSKTGDREMTLYCHNPYPSDFDYGLIYRVAALYNPPDGNLVVIHKDEQDANCRKNGGDACTYVISW